MADKVRELLAVTSVEVEEAVEWTEPVSSPSATVPGSGTQVLAAANNSSLFEISIVAALALKPGLSWAFELDRRLAD